MKIRNLPALALLGALAAAPCSAQELVAWPIGNPGVWRSLLPGIPVRPLPPRPIHPPRPGPSPAPAPSPVRVSGYHVDGKIQDGAAELTYDIVFHNPTSARLEGVLLVPLPANAAVSGFKMTVGGKTMNAELLESGQAATVYENIVRQMRDPGLLELVGERLLRARVFPIEPNSDIKVRLVYTQILEKSGELYALTVPMRSAKMTGSSKSKASAQLALSASRPIRTLYSPNDGAKVARSGDRAASVSYEEREEGGDLRLFFSLQQSPLAASLLTFKESGEDGYFLLSLSPKPAASDAESTPKDIVFVVDRSGSMEEGGKMEQARKALAYCIGRLGGRDRFGIVDFATDSNAFEGALVAATPENRERALRYVRRLDSAGGTNIEAGLAEGLRLLSGEREGRTPMLFFLTDGIPTVGQTQVEALLRQAQESNRGVSARLFSFGVGDDVNTLFLDKLAEGNRGARDYAAPGEDIEHKLSSLYQKVARPALTDVKVDWGGLDAIQVYPRPIADIFHGGELVLMGRYKDSGKGTLVVTGRSNGRTARFEYPVELPKDAPSNAFLPRLWANLKIAHELDAIRLSGKADPETVQSIVRLAKKHGIVTPYTSFLITEEGMDLRGANRSAERQMIGLRADAAGSGFSSDAPMARRAQKASLLMSMLRGKTQGAFAQAQPESSAASMSDALKLAEKDAMTELQAKGEAVLKKRDVAGKAFYFRGGRWLDGECENACEGAKEIRYLSEEYFELLSSEPGLRRYMAIGSNVTVLWKGKAYRIVE